MSFQRGRWSCSCVVCWKDKATVRASDGWHSTSTDFINSFMLAAAAALKCCAVQWDTAYWLTVLQSASGASLLPTICVYVLLLIIWTMCSVVSLYSDHSAQRCLNQFIGIMGSGCVCRAFICHLCWVCVQQHVRWRWWKVISFLWLGIDIVCILRNLYMSLFIRNLMIILQVICICCDCA